MLPTEVDEAGTTSSPLPEERAFCERRSRRTGSRPQHPAGRRALSVSLGGWRCEADRSSKGRRAAMTSAFAEALDGVQSSTFCCPRCPAPRSRLCGPNRSPRFAETLREPTPGLEPGTPSLRVKRVSSRVPRLPANAADAPERLVRGSPQKSTALQECVPTCSNRGH
jgi:hypothetical protein